MHYLFEGEGGQSQIQSRSLPIKLIRHCIYKYICKYNMYDRLIIYKKNICLKKSTKDVT